jgi:hypothetical protein
VEEGPLPPDPPSPRALWLPDGGGRGTMELRAPRRGRLRRRPWRCARELSVLSEIPYGGGFERRRRAHPSRRGQRGASGRGRPAPSAAGLGSSTVRLDSSAVGPGARGPADFFVFWPFLRKNLTIRPLLERIQKMDPQLGAMDSGAEVRRIGATDHGA